MKLANSATDASAIRAQLSTAFKGLHASNNPNGLDGVDDKGGTLVGGNRAGVVDGGKVKEIKLISPK